MLNSKFVIKLQRTCSFGLLLLTSLITKILNVDLIYMVFCFNNTENTLRKCEFKIARETNLFKLNNLINTWYQGRRVGWGIVADAPPKKKQLSKTFQL